LFEGSKWKKDDSAVPLQLIDLGPGQVFQKHISGNGVGISGKRKTENVKRKERGLTAKRLKGVQNSLD
jgi:hypothetical protein